MGKGYGPHADTRRTINYAMNDCPPFIEKGGLCSVLNNQPCPVVLKIKDKEAYETYQENLQANSAEGASKDLTYKQGEPHKFDPINSEPVLRPRLFHQLRGK